KRTFWDLGGDSLRLVQLTLGVEELTGLPLPISTFLLDPTLSALCEIVQRVSEQPGAHVHVFRRQGSGHPLFCIHGLDGDVAGYGSLAEALGDDQPVFGLQSPGLSRSGILPTSIEAAAEEIIERVRQITDDPSPAFLGYSWAGLLAFEVGRQWLSAGAGR